MLYMRRDIKWNEDGTAEVSITSPHSGKVNTVKMTMTRDAYWDWAERGLLIQDALPRLSPDEREFLMTGLTAEDWKEVFPPEEETS